MKKGIKDVVAPQGMFEDLGLKYIGPVDGHDVQAMERALRQARSYGGPVIVHAITMKGKGYPPAIADEADQFHAVGVIDPETGVPVSGSGRSWTSEFADELVRIGHRRDDVVAITAAMMIPTGLHRFAAEFPTRVFDVGIAEQHAVTSAAGLAFTGLHPVVAVYATFLNRAFDQVLMDVALHRAGVTFVLDRAGVTGPDGASHHGMWDLAVLQVVPGVRVAAPRDAARLVEELGEAVEVSDAPTVLRIARDSVPDDIPALERVGGVDVLARGDGNDVLVVAVGSLATMALDVAKRLAAQGISATVVDPRWVLPVDPALLDLVRAHRLVVTVEDGVRVGGVGARLAQEMRDQGIAVPLHDVGIPCAFHDHGSRQEVLEDIGLTAQSVARDVAARVARLDDRPGHVLT